MSGLTPERWQVVAPLLDQIFATPDKQRPALAIALAGEDAELRAELAALIAAAEASGGILDRSAEEYVRSLLDDSEPDGDFVGERIGPWRIRSEIGRGGMGVVYLAERADGAFEQRVALKLLRRGIDTDEVLERFRRERQILARLEHPCIARILDGGATADGRPYFAMEHVEGQPITAWCDSRRVSVEERLRLFIDVCAAVDHAHRRLVVYRDLKPSNILVTAAGEVKLLDFGIAKLLGAGEEGVTRAGRRLMTPRYAAPEQVQGDAVTTATDTYALGLVLYELLVGRSPYRLARESEAELERAVLEQEPEAPSAAVLRRDERLELAPAQVAARRAVTPERLRRRLRGDLDAIVLTALRKEPDRRYRSAEALAQDLRALRDGEPVSARRSSSLYRFGKLVSRHRVAVAAATLIALALAVGLASTLWQARLARREAHKAREVKEFLASLFKVSSPDESMGRTITAQEILDRGAERIQKELGSQPEVQAEMLTVVGEVYRDLGLYDRSTSVLERAVSMRRQPGGRPAELAASVAALGNARRGEGNLPAAESLLREALETSEAASGSASEATARIQSGLAETLADRGEYVEAERLLRAAHAALSRSLGGEHPDVARTLAQLGGVLHRRGAYADAIAALQGALKILRRGPLAESWHTAVVLNRLGATLQESGDPAAAVEAHTQALDLQRRVLGEHHPEVATTLHDLATVRLAQGDLDAAAALYEQVVSLYRQSLGAEHHWLATALHDLAKVKLLQQDPGAAERLLKEALQIYRRALGPDHEWVSMALASLASAYIQQGDLAAAEPLLRDALAGYRRAFPAGHPVTGTVLVLLGRLLGARGLAQEAEPLLREAHDSWLAAFGPDDRRTAEARIALGASLTSQGRYTQAEELLLAAEQALVVPRGPGAASVQDARQGLVDLYQKWGRDAEAVRYRTLAKGTGPG